MNALGIYFGSQVISIVETKRKNPINNIQIPHSAISTAELLEEKVPEEVKLVTLLKDELRKKGVEAKEVTVCLSGKDLIIRTFEMPIFVSRGELRTNAVHFEAKKYIPFKVEELVSDFQWKFDKSIKKNRALFVGIKKETLDKYRFMLNQLDFKINSIEYSAFSVLRLFKLTGVVNKGIVAVADIDFMEEDESNFMVLEDGFPLFSRDITFASESAQVTKTKDSSVDTALDKLKREIRISLDYYHRKFPVKNIKKIFFIASEDYRSELEAFIKDMGLSTQFIDVTRYIGKPAHFSLSFVKGYSSSLSKMIKTSLKIDLLAAKPYREAAVPIEKISLLILPKVSVRVAVLCLLTFISAFLFGLYHSRRLPLQKELKNIISIRPQVSTVRQDAGYEELNARDLEYKQKINTLDNLINKQLSLTLIFDIIPRILPEGIWLENFSFRQNEGRIDLSVGGAAYLGNNTEEIEAVNRFVASLKEEQAINRYFKTVDLVSLNRNQAKQGIVTNFAISCRSY